MQIFGDWVLSAFSGGTYPSVPVHKPALYFLIPTTIYETNNNKQQICLLQGKNI
jgi:hypothetical protein